MEVGLSTQLNWLSSRNFFQGAKSIVMQISFVMLLFSYHISGRGHPRRKKASKLSSNDFFSSVVFAVTVTMPCVHIRHKKL